MAGSCHRALSGSRLGRLSGAGVLTLCVCVEAGGTLGAAAETHQAYISLLFIFPMAF